MQERITGWPPVNLTASTLQGIELVWRWNLSPDGFYSTWTVTYTRAENATAPHAGNQLPFVPLFDGRAAVGGRLGNVRGEIAVYAMSRRYTTLDNVAALSANPFAVVSCWGEYGLWLAGSIVTLRASVDNVFNSDYEIVASYPMPLRSVRFGIRFDL
jgi:outer membrane cobalamin receptor